MTEGAMAKKLKPKNDTNEQIPDSLKFLPEHLVQSLMNLIKKSGSTDEFIRQILVGDCPVCGSSKTTDCSELSTIDPTVGVCLQCYTFWCLECGIIFIEGQTICEHWQICMKCNECAEEKCETSADDCMIIEKWIKQKQYN